MTYSQKLRDPRWQRKRLLILERDGWKCCACGDEKKNLQVHHLVYARKDPWDYDDEFLQTLCEDCHELRQRLTDVAVDRFRMRLKDIPNDDLVDVSNRVLDSVFEGTFYNMAIRSVVRDAFEKAEKGEAFLTFDELEWGLISIGWIAFYGKESASLEHQLKAVKRIVEKVESEGKDK